MHQAPLKLCSWLECCCVGHLQHHGADQPIKQPKAKDANMPEHLALEVIERVQWGGDQRFGPLLNVKLYCFPTSVEALHTKRVT